METTSIILLKGRFFDKRRSNERGWKDEIYYIKSWGADINTQMEDGNIENNSDFVKLYNWLWEKTYQSQ